jgi:hypothetical protein
MKSFVSTIGDTTANPQGSKNDGISRKPRPKRRPRIGQKNTETLRKKTEGVKINFSIGLQKSIPFTQNNAHTTTTSVLGISA